MPVQPNTFEPYAQAQQLSMQRGQQAMQAAQLGANIYYSGRKDKREQAEHEVDFEEVDVTGPDGTVTKKTRAEIKADQGIQQGRLGLQVAEEAAGLKMPFDHDMNPETPPIQMSAALASQMNSALRSQIEMKRLGDSEGAITALNAMGAGDSSSSMTPERLRQALLLYNIVVGGNSGVGSTPGLAGNVYTPGPPTPTTPTAPVSSR